MYSDDKYDKFYIKSTVVKKILINIKFQKYDLVIEPFAKNGAFSLRINNKNLISLDINPNNVNVQKMNWFNYQIDMKFKNVLVKNYFIYFIQCL